MQTIVIGRLDSICNPQHSKRLYLQDRICNTAHNATNDKTKSQLVQYVIICYCTVALFVGQ